MRKSKRSSKQSLKKRSFVKDRNILEKISSYKSYHYEELNDLQDKNIISFSIKEKLLEHLPKKKYQYLLKKQQRVLLEEYLSIYK